MRWVKFGAVVLVTDLTRYNHESFFNFRSFNSKLIHRKHSTEKRVVQGVPPLPIDYELDVLRLPGEVLETDFMLFQEWDSGVLNPDAWEPEFLQYDYIGAPWPDHEDKGWPKCDSSNNVGNGGFCLKSAKFCKWIRETTIGQNPNPAMLSSDRWQCRTMRPTLEQHGIRYAPESVAARFSCENKIYAGSFGFHGRLTALMNNWSGPWLGKIRPDTK